MQTSLSTTFCPLEFVAHQILSQSQIGIWKKPVQSTDSDFWFGPNGVSSGNLAYSWTPQLSTPVISSISFEMNPEMSKRLISYCPISCSESDLEFKSQKFVNLKTKQTKQNKNIPFFQDARWGKACFWRTKLLRTTASKSIAPQWRRAQGAQEKHSPSKFLRQFPGHLYAAFYCGDQTSAAMSLDIPSICLTCPLSLFQIQRNKMNNIV